MALWGTKDTVYSTGNVNLNVTTGALTRQSGTINWSTIAAGDVVTVADDGAGVGEGVVVSIDTATGNSAQLTMTTAIYLVQTLPMWVMRFVRNLSLL